MRAVDDHRPSAAPRLWLYALGAVLAAASCGSGSGETDPSGGPSEPASIDVDVEVQGHRGARGLKPENTLPAFEAALDLLVPVLELDLHMTADGHLVLLHDPGIDRRKCGLSADATDAYDPDSRIQDPKALRVAEMTSHQIAQYWCDRNPDSEQFPAQDNEPTDLAGDNFAVVELDQLFDFVDLYAASPTKTDVQRANAATVRFNIETKRDPRDPSAIGDNFDGINPGRLEVNLLEEITLRSLETRVTVQSFDHRSLWAIRSVQPDITLVALTNGPIPDFEDLAARGATIWSPNQSAINQSVVRAAHSAGLKVIVWTVNDEADMIRLVELGVDGLITDRPDIAMPLLSAGG